MNDKGFDDIIKAKLLGLNSESDPRWDLFLEKKKSIQALKEDTFFDQTVRAKVLDQTASYNSEHWTLLKNQVNHIFTLRHKINSYKSLELACILLFCLTAFNYFSDLNYNDHTAHAQIQKIDNQIVNKLLGPALLAQNFQQNSNQKSDATILTASKPKENKVNHKTTKRTQISANNSNSKITSSIEISAVLNSNQNNKMDKVTSTDYSASENFTAKNMYESINDSSFKINKENAFQAAHDVITLSSIQTLELTDGLSSEKHIPVSALIIPENKARSISKSWLSFVASIDNNIISTPADPLFELSEKKTNIFSYTLGAKLSQKIKALEYGTGLFYSKINKASDIVTEYSDDIGFYAFSFTNLSYDLINIPLFAQYHFAQSNKWSMFATVGFNTNLIAASDFKTESELVAPKPLIPGTNPNTLKPSEAPYLTSHNFNNGLLQGGNLIDNIFVQSVVGVGFERKINPSTSIFLSGDYMMSLINDKVGPSNDSYNKLSFSFGAKFGL